MVSGIREITANEQLSALEGAGVEQFFINTDEQARPGQWRCCLERLNAGDTLLVWRIQVLGSSLRDLVEALECLRFREIRLVSLTEKWASRDGQFSETFDQVLSLFRIYASEPESGPDALDAEVRFDAEIVRQGFPAEKARGVQSVRAAAVRKSDSLRAGRVGRPLLLDQEQLQQIVHMRQAGMSLNRIAQDMGVGRMTVSRALARTSYQENADAPGRD
ncbi:helix-turn-helix domain-containing protein [Acaricomes phytoseiuli]|uniref:helix-turn-helix domain-containing protein n=1 Tax=Acaricomes phytoseiuli TaxID=291968 RepID=UPI00222207C8|nr:helix-turn-helix domain-containing protein [Acaricomes phytoseiuli]MCW1249576.1 helix-turn-helix domain-containing protein [Acaricomes phytoseiuli]